MFMQRRLLISMLCLSLAGLAPVPLSACAMLMASPADCSPAPAKAAPAVSHCEQAATAEGANQDTFQADASKLPCCELRAAPAPDASAGISKVNVAPASASLEDGPQAVPSQALDRTIAQTEFEQFTSPPDRQPLLCTFLI